MGTFPSWSSSSLTQSFDTPVFMPYFDLSNESNYTSVSISISPSPRPRLRSQSVIKDFQKEQSNLFMWQGKKGYGVGVCNCCFCLRDPFCQGLIRKGISDPPVVFWMIELSYCGSINTIYSMELIFLVFVLWYAFLFRPPLNPY